MSVSNPTNYLNDLQGFRSQIEAKVGDYKDKKELLGKAKGLLKNKALEQAQKTIKQGENLVQTAYESAVGMAGAKVVGKVGGKIASMAKEKLQSLREGAANNQGNQTQGIDREEGTEMNEMKSGDVIEGETRGRMATNVPDRVEMDEDFEGYERAGAGEVQGAETKVADEDDDAVEGVAEAGEETADVGGEIAGEAGAEVAAEGLGEAAAATSWIPFVGEILAGAAAATGIGAGVAGLVEEGQGGDEEKKAEAMPNNTPKAPPALNIAGSYVVPTRSSLLV